MYYNEKFGQWIATDIKDMRTMRLTESILAFGIKCLKAGQILIFVKGYDKLAFQTLENINLDSAKGSHLVGYEPGSVMHIRYKKAPKIIPTILLRDCRLPTAHEFSIYNSTNNL